MPDVTIVERSPEDEYVVIACDGIWDCKTNEQACEYLSAEIAAQGGLKEWHHLTTPIESLLEALLTDEMGV